MSLRVLIHIPGLKGGEQHGGGNASKDPASEQPPEVGGQLGEAAEGVDDSKGDGHLPPAPDVSQGPSAGAKEDTGGKASHIEDSYLGLSEAIVGIQFVDIGPLQPVTKQGTEVDNVETLLETKEGILRTLMKEEVLLNTGTQSMIVTDNSQILTS